MDAATTQALAALQEIPLPPPISYRPATTAWSVVGLVLLAALAYAAWRWFGRWQANAYRREALREMADLERRFAQADARVGALTALPALVKRTALAAMPRARVASLSDAQWLAFLDRTCPPGGFASGPGTLLPRIAYQTIVRPTPAELHQLVALVRRWITHHDVRL
jgi:hypothetical protein